MDKRSWYLSLSNHQSWADIFIVQMITNRKVPMLKFFMKFVLIYVPVIGICWWALDMPFLKRYSKDQLERNPFLRGKDFASMKRSFKKYSLYPISVFSFAEGTRFTEQKHKDQNSPYNNLLKPKEGGLSAAISTMPRLDKIIDFTIIYESKKRSFWDFLRGNMNNARILVRSLDIPDKFKNDQLHENDGLRKEFKEWLNEIWHKKDKLINENIF